MEFTDHYRANCYLANLHLLVAQFEELFSDPTMKTRIQNGVLFGNDDSIPQGTQMIKRTGYILEWDQSNSQLYLRTPILTWSANAFIKAGGDFKTYQTTTVLKLYEFCLEDPKSVRFVFTLNAKNILVDSSTLSG